MTRAEITALSPRELDARLAEWMGWTDIRDKFVRGFGKPVDFFAPVPHYHDNLNAMAVVEAKLARRGLYVQYTHRLLELLTLPKSGPKYVGDEFKLATAPALVRARAACLAVLGEG